tara:strand:+ start:107 stop:820 length:714 start_codon:yes stop_codon:yes gene_type:complete
MIKNKIAILLAARSDSKRLPGKHFLKLNRKYSVIDLCISRLKKVNLANQIFLCTTKRKNDDKFKAVCKKHNIKLFRGSTNNVLKRLIDCAKESSIKIIVRITADCPIIDPNVIDKCIELHIKKKNDYTTNTLKLTFPDGLDVEVINLNALIISQKLSKSLHNKEHVTSFIRKSKLFKKSNYKNLSNYSNRRWTLDYMRDYLFLKKVVKFFSKNTFFSWKDLIKMEKINKSLINIEER